MAILCDPIGKEMRVPFPHKHGRTADAVLLKPTAHYDLQMPV